MKVCFASALATGVMKLPKYRLLYLEHSIGGPGVLGKLTVNRREEGKSLPSNYHLVDWY